MTLSEPPILVAALYQFTAFADLPTLQAPLAKLCCAQGVKGTLLLAPEGINGTIAGTADAIHAVLAHIRTMPGCTDLDVKFSPADAMPFHRMKVRLKREIVTMGVDGVDPVNRAGTYVEPADWNALISDPETVVIDTRNDYEVGIGRFQGAIDPKTPTFRDFPAWFRDWRASRPADAPLPKIAMYCTGGIRCEKSTAFLRGEGIDQVFHLKGGILRYLETVPEADSMWQGECFVFDQRVAVTHGVVPGTYELCHACRLPVSPADKLSPHYVEGVQCPACYAARDDAQRQRYAERQRQMRIAEKRGVAHVGAVLRPGDDD